MFKRLAVFVTAVLFLLCAVPLNAKEGGGKGPSTKAFERANDNASFKRTEMKEEKKLEKESEKAEKEAEKVKRQTEKEAEKVKRQAKKDARKAAHKAEKESKGLKKGFLKK